MRNDDKINYFKLFSLEYLTLMTFDVFQLEGVVQLYKLYKRNREEKNREKNCGKIYRRQTLLIKLTNNRLNFPKKLTDSLFFCV